jgi:glutaminase
LGDYAGGAKIGFDQAVYLSERETAYNNNALAYFMSSKNGFPQGANVQDSLDFYFQLCSIEVTNKKLATIASTYANNGVCPITGKKCMSSHTVKRCMQLLFSCGMYDYSGEWACTVGLPAKSGVAGAVFVVVPSVCGICIWSPPLNDEGNSVRGVDFAEKLVEKKNWNTFDVIFNSKKDHIL